MTTTDRTKSLDEEKACVSACLQQRSMAAAALDIAERRDFDDPRCRAVAEELGSHPDADQVEIAHAVAVSGLMPANEVKGFLAELMTIECSGVRALEHAAAVHDAAQRRRLLQIATDLATQARTSPDSSTDLVERFGGQLFGLSDRATDSQLRAVGDVLGEVFDQLAHQQAGLPGIDTGFPCLNDITGGWQNGALNVLAARPSLGKTTFAMNTALRAARVGGVVYVATVEMTAAEVTKNLLCNVGGVSSSVMRTGRMTTIEYQRMAEAAEALRPIKLLLDATPAPTTMGIRSRTKRIALKHGRIDLVVVDYLQLLREPDAETREQQVSAISRSLKQLARELDCPVIAVAQLNRAPEARKGKQPQLGDLRESGAIEQDADLVILLHERDATGCADGPSTRRVDAIVAKNRNGPRGTVALRLVGPQFRFEEVEVSK